MYICAYERGLNRFRGWHVRDNILIILLTCGCVAGLRHDQTDVCAARLLCVTGAFFVASPHGQGWGVVGLYLICPRGVLAPKNSSHKTSLISVHATGAVLSL